MTRKKAFWMVHFIVHILMSSPSIYDTTGVVARGLCINTIAFHVASSGLEFSADYETDDMRLCSCAYTSHIVQWEKPFFVPPIWKDEFIQRSHNQRNDEPTNGPPRLFALSLYDHYLLWFELQTSTLRSPVLRNFFATRRPSRGLSGKVPRPP